MKFSAMAAVYTADEQHPPPEYTATLVWCRAQVITLRPQSECGRDNALGEQTRTTPP